MTHSLPTRRSSDLTVEVPARQPAKVLQAAPFVLEEQLAEDVDTLHFALGARQADHRWPLAIVSQTRMQAWLALLQDFAIHADAMVPDVLAQNGSAACRERWCQSV